MWVIYHKKSSSVVGMSADCEPDLDRAFALQEVVKGLNNPSALSAYDAIQVSERDRARLLHNTPIDQLVLTEVYADLVWQIF